MWLLRESGMQVLTTAVIEEALCIMSAWLLWSMTMICYQIVPWSMWFWHTAWLTTNSVCWEKEKSMLLTLSSFSSVITHWAIFQATHYYQLNVTLLFCSRWSQLVPSRMWRWSHGIGSQTANSETYHAETQYIIFNMSDFLFMWKQHCCLIFKNLLLHVPVFVHRELRVILVPWCLDPVS
jgi:hypothetical protein